MDEGQKKLAAVANAVAEMVDGAVQTMWEARRACWDQGRAEHPQRKQVFALLLGRALLEQAVGFLLVGGSDKATALALLEESWAVTAECVAEVLDDVSAVNSPGGDM